MDTGGNRRGVALFLAIAFGWSWAAWVPPALAAQGLIESSLGLDAWGAFGPSVAGFVLAYRAGGLAGMRALARRAVTLDYPKRWLLVALLLGPALVGVSLAVAYATGTEPAYPWAGQPVVLAIAFVFVLFLGGPIQEEFGWRGYLLDAFQGRGGATVAGVAVGLVWALWHLPLFFSPSNTIYYQRPYLGFVVSITLLSVLMTWVYNNTDGSLLPMLLLHAAWNWAQGMFPILESDPASLALLVAQAALVVVVVGYWGPWRLARTPVTTPAGPGPARRS